MALAHPLSFALPGQRVRIASVIEKPLRLRLLSLGLAPGTTLTILRNGASAVVVGKNDDRLAIGRSLAERILVQPEIP
ncbi:MAG: FeoA domain-containing protein [Methylohalobius sp.]